MRRPYLILAATGASLLAVAANTIAFDMSYSLPSYVSLERVETK